MHNDDIRECLETIDTAKRCTRVNKNDFVDFIRYCADRLEKGDSVQAIWSDYQLLQSR